MGENAQKVGKKLEIMGTQILSLFQWKEKMRDKEIECKRSPHKNPSGDKKKSHGIDMYLEYNDPYQNKVQGVFIECKNRKWSNISKVQIENWVKEEINLMECAAYNNSLIEFYDDGSDRNCALILINVNDGKFNKNKFYEYISKIEIGNKRNSYRIFIAGNDMIEKWDGIHKINQSEFQGQLKVIYPSINNSKPMIGPTWGIDQLYSKYIFCEVRFDEAIKIGDRKTTYEKKRLVVFCMDKIQKESIYYLWSMCRAYQYEVSYDEFSIYFYPNCKDDVDYINENLINILKSYKAEIDPEIIKKIKVGFLRNSELSVVDNM